jgi:hypothetical protein
MIIERSKVADNEKIESPKNAAGEHSYHIAQ